MGEREQGSLGAEVHGREKEIVKSKERGTERLMWISELE